MKTLQDIGKNMAGHTIRFPDQTLVLATIFSLIVLLGEPYHSLAIPAQAQSGNRHGNHHSTQHHKTGRNNNGKNHDRNSEEIQVYLPAVPQGSFQGPPGMGMSQANTQPPATAFSAHRLTGLSVTSGSKNITYDKEELDLTNTFAHSKGYFQCQIPGLYYFSFTFWARSSTPLKIRLQQNGRAKAALFVGRGTLLEQASQNAILSLKEGDRVWLEAYAPSIITPATTPINIFNGYLINAFK